MKKKSVKVLELFSGIGGMHYALKEAQKILPDFEFNVVRAIDISDVANQVYKHNFPNVEVKGKSLSEALIFALTNPQYDDRLFTELQVQYMKIPSSNLGRTCCVQKLFLTFRTIFVHNMFSLCSAKRRASYKDLPVKAVTFAD